MTAREWRLLVHDTSYACIATDDIGENRVTTTWLGTVPLFETAVIARSGPASAERVASYEDESRARAGHAAVVRRLRGAGSAVG